MSITIIEQPQRIVLSGNQAVIKVQTDNHLEQGAYNIIDWKPADDGFDATAFFRIINRSYGIDVWIRVGTSPDWDVVILPRSDFANFDAYLLHVADRMTESPLMGYFYECGSMSPAIRMTSRIMRSYNVQIIHRNQVVVNHIVQQGADPVIKSGFRIGFRILDGSHKIMKTEPELREPDFLGYTTLDLGDYFSAVSEIERPTSTAKIKTINGGVNTFRLEVFEWFNNDIVDNPTIIKFVSVAGKSSFMQEALWNEEGNSFHNYATNALNFLSSQPRLKNTAPNSFELLYFFNSETRTISLKTKVYLSDGNASESTSATLSVAADKMVEFDVSPQKLNVFQYEAGELTVLGYDVWLEATGISFHEIRQFRFDRNRYDQSRTFLVRNDIGRVWETIRATGEAVVSSKFERNSIERNLPLNYTTSDSNVEDIENKVIYEFELNWGFLSRFGDARAWKHYIMAVELSRKVFELVGGYMVPCKFITNEADFDADSRDFYTHTSKYRRAYFDTAYSPDDIPVVGDYNDDYNDDYYN